MFYSTSDDDYIQIDNDGSLDTQQSLTILLWFFAEDGHTAPLISNSANGGLKLFYSSGRLMIVSNLLKYGEVIFLKQIYLLFIRLLTRREPKSDLQL